MVDWELPEGREQGFKSLCPNLAKYLIHSKCLVPGLKEIKEAEPTLGLGVEDGVMTVHIVAFTLEMLLVPWADSGVGSPHPWRLERSWMELNQWCEPHAFRASTGNMCPIHMAETAPH